MKTIIKCINCGRELIHHAKHMCCTCYKKLAWKPKSIECKRCKRMLPMHAKGLCKGCYSSVYHLEEIKAFNYKKWHKISIELYKEITKCCILCDFDKIIELHHLDRNHDNNSRENLIGLCPNHHMMLHKTKYHQEIIQAIKEKGFNAVPFKLGVIKDDLPS